MLTHDAIIADGWQFTCHWDGFNKYCKPCYDGRCKQFVLNYSWEKDDRCGRALIDNGRPAPYDHVFLDGYLYNIDAFRHITKDILRIN